MDKEKKLIIKFKLIKLYLNTQDNVSKKVI